MLKRPVNKLLKHLGRDPRINAALGTRPAQMEQGLDQMENSWVGKHGIPIALGLAPAAVALAMNVTPRQPYYGLNSWTVKKKAALKKIASLWQANGYQPQIDFSQTLNPNTVVSMIQHNPFLKDSPYQRNLGTSIITAAKAYGNQTTLGSIYDSAVNKFDTKLKFEGVTDKAVKSLVQGSLAGMFTDVVGSVMGLPQPVRGQVANTVGFAQALYSILN